MILAVIVALSASRATAAEINTKKRARTIVFFSKKSLSIL